MTSNESVYPKWLLQLTVVVSGFLILSVEIISFRMFSPFFGSSVYITGALLGCIMVAMALGAYFGGRLSDRVAHWRTIYWVLFVADILLFALFSFYHPVLSYFATGNLISGSLISAFILLFLPMTLLSVAVPFVIRFMARQNKMGSVSGRISAASTIGCIVAVFFTTFVMIPYIGVKYSLLINALVLFLLCFPPLLATPRKALPMLVFLLVALPGLGKKQSNLFYDKDSVYNDIKVEKITEDGSLAYNLIMNNISQGSRTMQGDPATYYEFWHYFSQALPVMVGDCRRICILGLNCGGSAERYASYWPGTEIDGVEIDPDVIKLGYDYFGFSKIPGLKVYENDARIFLQHTSSRYDVVEVDAFQSGEFIPAHLATREFFQLISERLTDRGMVLVNLYIPPGSATNPQGKPLLAGTFCNTVKSAMPHVFTVTINNKTKELDDKYGSFVAIIAAKNPIGLPEIRERLDQFTHTDSLLVRAVGYVKKRIETFEPYPSSGIFTDDISAVELMQGVSPKDTLY